VADLGRGPGTRDLVLGIFDRGHLPGSSTCCGWKIPDCAAAACVAAAEAGSPRKASALPMKKVPPSRLCTSASLAISLVDSSSTSAKTTEGLAVWGVFWVENPFFVPGQRGPRPMLNAQCLLGGTQEIPIPNSQYPMPSTKLRIVNKRRPSIQWPVGGERGQRQIIYHLFINCRRGRLKGCGREN